MESGAEEIMVRWSYFLVGYHESSDVGVHELMGLEDGVPEVSVLATPYGHCYQVHQCSTKVTVGLVCKMTGRNIKS